MSTQTASIPYSDLLGAADGTDDGLLSTASAVGSSAEPVVPIALEDLLPDSSGDVVLSAAEGMTIELHSRQELVESGVKDHHVTASGLDVTGFEYCSFASGMTVYFPHDFLVRISFEALP